MTQSLFDKVEDCAQQFKEKLGSVAETVSGVYQTPCLDFEYSSTKFRRAHVSVVDARKTKKVFLLHCTVFPHINDPSPIFGYDIVCGPTKVSGAFHDFSITADPTHPMWLWFNAKVAVEEWNKPRDLPEWGQQIFSPAMVAIGAVGPEELDRFITLGLETLDFYLANLAIDIKEQRNHRVQQNRYCTYQKQNPRTVTSLVHLGFTEEQAVKYVDNMLFPLVK